MSTHDRTLGAIEAFYDAAMDENLWPAALDQLVELTGSQAATFWMLDSSEKPRHPTFIYVNFDPIFIPEYLAHMATLDPTVQYLVKHPQQAIVHDGLVITEGEKDRHAYYDWHGRYSDTRFRMLGQVRVATTVQAGIALHRAKKVGRYESSDIERFAVLYRHLQQALRIGVRLGSLGALQQLSTELMDRHSAAIVLLDKHMRVVFVNRRARALQASGDGIVFGADGVKLACRRDHDKLQKLIAKALTPDGLADGGTMQVFRPSGKRPYGAFVTPVSRQYSALTAVRPAVCLVLTDPDSCPRLSTLKLQVLFGLTHAEALLAAELAAGTDLRDAAHKLSITYGTARTRLAQIYQKTETRRQGDLIRVLLTSMPAC